MGRPPRRGFREFKTACPVKGLTSFQNDWDLEQSKGAHLEGDGGVQNCLPVQGFDKVQDKVQQELQIHHGSCSRWQCVQLGGPARPEAAAAAACRAPHPQRPFTAAEDRTPEPVSHLNRHMFGDSVPPKAKAGKGTAQLHWLCWLTNRSQDWHQVMQRVRCSCMQIDTNTSFEPSSLRTLSWAMPSLPPLVQVSP